MIDFNIVYKKAYYVNSRKSKHQLKGLVKTIDKKYRKILIPNFTKKN